MTAAESAQQLRDAATFTVDHAIGHCDHLDVLRTLAAQYRKAMLAQHYMVDHLIADDCKPCRKALEECDGHYSCDDAKDWQRQFTAALCADRIIPVRERPQPARCPRCGHPDFWHGGGRCAGDMLACDCAVGAHKAGERDV